MTGQLENPQNSQNTKYLRRLGNGVKRMLGSEKVQNESNIEWKNAQKINDVEEGYEKVKLFRRDYKPNDVLESEPADKYRFCYPKEVDLFPFTIDPRIFLKMTFVKCIKID